ncbi:dihydrodipicolinate synthase family protein [Bradyrhizobium sp. SRL28]|uniref:dihydrodipicolinate synthase family protein n=1 Tax=Bradyrhizobium sp. SRL28 TaxID=2836178 RepID=UPI001BDEDE56|nr:dihydrodipicolinate synthase family protein [Bradyrhizobium sp. SRL28]MBT1516472.1 dihydrodipicolinate synthase family protein [Bradyrhizobium sp. SRL28]
MKIDDTGAGADKSMAASQVGNTTKALYWVAAVTPCDKAGRFDPGAMRAIMEWHKQAGADGIVVLGTTGEFPSFSVAERKQVAKTVLNNKNGLNVIIGPGTPNIAETIDLAHHAEAHGADGLLVIPPFYFNQPPIEGLTAYFSMLFDAVQLPTSLYHYPQTSRVPISFELLKNLKHYPYLAGIKDSSGDPVGYSEFVRTFPDLNMCSGSIKNIGIALENGMGAILGEGNAFSKKCADIFTAYRERGDWRAAIAKLIDAQKAIDDAAADASYSAAQKYILGLEMGMAEIYVRAPYVQLTDAQRSSLKAAFERIKATEK